MIASYRLLKSLSRLEVAFPGRRRDPSPEAMLSGEGAAIRSAHFRG